MTEISAAARAYHDELFPGHVSALAATDPELVAFFGNFAFDEVIAESNLPTRLRLLLILASLIAQNTMGEYRAMLGAALNVGISPIEAKEVVYQCLPYVGIGRVYDALNVTNDVLAARGVPLPLPPQSTTTPATRHADGLAAQKAIVGAARVDAMYAAAPPAQLHIQKFLSANCFGDHYTRTGLDLATREVLTFAILISLGGCEPQVKGHVAGNANLGRDKAFLLDVITQLIPFNGYPRSLNALACLNEVLPEVSTKEN